MVSCTSCLYVKRVLQPIMHAPRRCSEAYACYVRAACMPCRTPCAAASGHTCMHQQQHACRLHQTLLRDDTSVRHTRMRALATCLHCTSASTCANFNRDDDVTRACACNSAYHYEVLCCVVVTLCLPRGGAPLSTTCSHVCACALRVWTLPP